VRRLHPAACGRVARLLRADPSSAPGPRARERDGALPLGRLRRGARAWLAVACLLLAGPAAAATPLRVAVATSLGPAFPHLGRQLPATTAGVSVEIESGPSLELARRLLAPDPQTDVIIVADIEVFDAILLPAKAIKGYYTLCGNRLGILYTDRSKYASELTET